MKNEKRLKVIQYGLGPIGLAVARLLMAKPNVEIVGAVDIDKAIAGRDLGDLLGRPDPVGVTVTDDGPRLLARVKADAVIHTTGSRLKRIFHQLEEIVQAGKNVVSSAEELLFPAPENRELAARLDELARRHGVTVLGTGVNPGFVMDALPLTLTGICQEVDEVHVLRIVDAGKRRHPLQRKIGAGMTPELFRQKAAEKALGHVGLRESLLMIAERLGFVLEEVKEEIEPVLAAVPLRTEHFLLAEGQVAGLRNTCEGIKDGRKVITLDLRMYLGAQDPHDLVRIVGKPPVTLRIEGGIAGDEATAAILVNSLPLVVAASPGLANVKDLPAPECRP